MYNALWASRDVAVVEIVPIRADGLYAGQGNPSSRPPFAHLAIYTNCMMAGQSFWRFYQVSVGVNFKVDVDYFFTWMDKYLPGI